MYLRNNFLARYFYRILEKLILPVIASHFINPNHFTVVGLVLALLVPLGFYVHPIFGLLLIVFSGTADVIDGLLAKNQGMSTTFGAFLDSCFDRMSDFFYLVGFWILFLNSERLILASALIFLSFLFSFMVSYTKAKAEGLGGNCEKGFMERGMRTLYLILWALLLSVFSNSFDLVLWCRLIIFCVLTFFTMIQRIVHIRSHLY